MPIFCPFPFFVVSDWAFVKTRKITVEIKRNAIQNVDFKKIMCKFSNYFFSESFLIFFLIKLKLL